jgi:hypothetical protein
MGAARAEAARKARQNNPTTNPNVTFFFSMPFLLSWNLKIVFAKIPQPRLPALGRKKTPNGSGIIPPSLILLLF